MKKKNALVPYEEKKLVPAEKKQTNIKKIILPTIIIVAILILVLFISSLLNPSNKAKMKIIKYIHLIMKI